MLNNVITVYTDGSWHDIEGIRDKCYGAIYIPDYDEPDWAFFTDNPIYTQSRNVGGELMAAEFAINLIALNYDAMLKAGNDKVSLTVELYYDYEGVGKWLTGEWRCKKVLTQAYYSYVSKLTKDRRITIHPHHVKGHAGVAGNERVDVLASEAYKNDERCYDANMFVKEVLGR